MYEYKIKKFMAGETMKKWTMVSLKKGYIVKTNPEDSIPIGVLSEDCYMGDIVEVIIVG